MIDEGKTNPESPQESGPRKPYTKPSLASEPIFETLALACGKIPGQGGSCNLSPRSS
ncbi:MAG TPA: hypothetical protein VKG84_11180 [Candidatus Acidoferrales bacterium]|nr:hypothetical protein [Candidatus Acidoferrales bacterium]